MGFKQVLNLLRIEKHLFQNKTASGSQGHKRFTYSPYGKIGIKFGNG